MKPNAFNICPTCSYQNNCVLTKFKDQVWSCSEYSEQRPEDNEHLEYEDVEHNREAVMA